MWMERGMRTGEDVIFTSFHIGIFCEDNLPSSWMAAPRAFSNILLHPKNESAHHSKTLAQRPWKWAESASVDTEKKSREHGRPAKKQRCVWRKSHTRVVTRKVMLTFSQIGPAFLLSLSFQCAAAVYELLPPLRRSIRKKSFPQTQLGHLAKSNLHTGDD